MTNDVEIFFEDVPQQQNVLNVSTSVNESGDSELIVGLSAYQIAVNRGFVGTVEEWLLSLKGDKGDQGIQGLQGIRGIDGEQGERGLTGEKGDKGDDGLSAYDVAVLNGFAGTASEWLESLEGSNGFNGENGLSAYQIALQYGFEGDESQWIESLRGVNGNEGISGIDGESAYQVALRNGFVGSEVEWLDSLKATTDEVVDTTPQRKNLVPDGALETSDGQYQVFTSDNTNQLLPLLGAGGLTAEMTQVDWLDPKTNEFTVRVKIPAGLDTVDLDAPISPLVYVIFASTNLSDIFSGNGISTIVSMGYNIDAGVLQLMADGDTSGLTEIPYVIDQEIEIKYNKIYNTVTLKTLDNGTTVLAGYITTREHDLMNVAVMYANFSQPTPIVSLSAYVETTPIVVTVEDSLDKINTRIDVVESSIESLEQTNTSLGSRVDYLNGTQLSMQQQLSNQSNSISNVNHTVNQLSDTVNRLAQNSVTQQGVIEQVTQSVTQSLIPINQKIDSLVTLNAVIVTDPTIPITQQYNSSIEYYLLAVVYNQPDITGTHQIGGVLKRTIGTNTLTPVHFSFIIDRLFSVPSTAFSNRRVTVSYYERLRKWLPIDSDVVLGTNTYYISQFSNGNSKVHYRNNNQDHSALGLGLDNNIFKCVSVDYQKFGSNSFTLLIGQNPTYEIVINALSTGQVGLGIQSESSTVYYKPLITEPRVISDVPYTIIDSLLVLDVTEGDVVHIDCRKLENLTGVATDKVRVLFDVKLLKSAYTNNYFTELGAIQSKLSTLSQRLPSTVTSDDSIVSAIEKLQAQVNSLGGGSGGSGSSSVERKYPVNYWSNQLNTIAGSATSYNGTTVYMTYFSLPHTIKITRVNIPFTGVLANRKARLRLYKLDGNIATAVTETYDIPASTVDAVFDFVSELTIPSGEYFWAVQNTGTASASNSIRSIPAASTTPIPKTSVDNNSHNMVTITISYVNPLPDTVDVSVSTLSLVNVPAINMFVTG